MNHDIAHCYGNNLDGSTTCPIKGQCLRHTALSDHHCPEIVSLILPERVGTDCQHFINNNKKK